jgi:hypothetical protein
MLSRKVVMTPFFTANGQMILDDPPKRSKCNQDYFIQNLLPALNEVRTGNARLKMAVTLIVYVDISSVGTDSRSPRKCR